MTSNGIQYDVFALCGLFMMNRLDPSTQDCTFVIDFEGNTQSYYNANVYHLNPVPWKPFLELYQIQIDLWSTTQWYIYQEWAIIPDNQIKTM